MYIQTPNSPASEFVLAEENGITLTLRERFLPYRPIRIEGRQRAEFTWYPGSPEATVQMLGPDEGTIRLTGYWKDKFLEVGVSATTSSSIDAQRGRAGGFAPDTASITSTAALVQTVDTMRRMGRRITLQWAGLMRVGHIVSFSHTWHNVHDCEWEIEFAVLSQGEATVPSVSAVALTLPDAYAQAVKEALRIQDAIIKAADLPKWLESSAEIALIFERLQLLGQATAGALGDVARGYANSIFSVTQGARRTLAALTDTIVGLGIQVNTIADTAVSEALSFGIYGSADNAPLGEQLAANSRQRIVADTARKARYSFASSRRLLATQAAGDAAQVRTFIPPNDTDLRTISVQFYGTADYVHDLMIYNGLPDSRVPSGRTISIPPASAFSDRDTTRGS